MFSRSLEGEEQTMRGDGSVSWLLLGSLKVLMPASERVSVIEARICSASDESMVSDLDSTGMTFVSCES